MNSRDLLSAFAERLGWTVIHSLWQGAAIAGALCVILVALRRRTAAAKHAACFAGMVLMLVAAIATAVYDVAPARAPAPVAAPSVTAAISTPLELPPEPRRLEESLYIPRIEKVDPVPATPVPQPPVERTWQERLHPYLPFVACAWLAGVLLLSLRHLGAWLRISSWRRRGQVLDSATAALFERVRTHFAIRFSVAVRQSTTALAPMLIGVFRPMVILPARLLTGLTDEQLEAVFAHELAHFVRRDHWTNLAQVIIETIFFYHPAIWWMSRRTRIEREHAADDLALQVYADRRRYAGALARLAELEVGPAVAVAANGGPLFQRIRRIVLPPPRETATPGWTVSVTAAIALFGVFLLVRTMADDPVIITVKSGESLQQAINNAPAGAIVRLGEGRWTERIRLTKPVKIEGAGWEKTILWPDRHDPEAMKRHSALLERLKNHPTATQTVIREIVREIGPVDEPTILVQGTTGVSMLGVTVKGFTTPKTLTGVKQGISSHSLVRVQNGEAEFKDSVFTGYFRGIDIEEKGSATIDACLIAGLWSEGLVAHPNSKLRLTNSEARNCYYAGVVLKQGSDALIEKCRISGSAWHGVRYDDAAPVLRDNVIFGNAGSDVYASGRTKATLKGNLFLSGGVRALLGSEDLIKNNTFGGEKWGLSASGGAAPTVVRNIFAAQATAITCSTVNDSSPVAKVMGAPKLDGNIFWNVKTALKVGDQPHPLPPSNTEADPMFVDPANKNFALADNSPARAKSAGALNPLTLTGPWQLLAEEKAIIPDDDTRDSNYWKEPGKAAPSKKREEQVAKSREVIKAWVDDAFQLDSAEKRTKAIEKVRAAMTSDNVDDARAGVMAFVRLGPIEFDKASFRPAVRALINSSDPPTRAAAAQAFTTTGADPEDLPRIFALADDSAPEVRDVLSFVIVRLTNYDLTSKPASDAILKLMENLPQDPRSVAHSIWGAKFSPEIEARVLDFCSTLENTNSKPAYEFFYGALSTQANKSEASCKRLVELLANRDITNIAGRAAWGLQQGVAPDQHKLVSDGMVKVIEGRSDSSLRSRALQFVSRHGDASHAPALKALVAKPGVTGQFRDELEQAIMNVERRP